MQLVSDIFLGWSTGMQGNHGYVRQRRDIKIKFEIEELGKSEMLLDTSWCGQSLALSHARSGDPALITGYLGKSDTFDRAMARFAVAYADQNDKDHAAFRRAISRGKLKALNEKPT